MLFIAGLLAALVCTFATIGTAIVDSRTLKSYSSIKVGHLISCSTVPV